MYVEPIACTLGRSWILDLGTLGKRDIDGMVRTERIARMKLVNPSDVVLR